MPNIGRRRFFKWTTAGFVASSMPSAFAAEQSEVIIIGAGLAGLYAAELLKQQGMKVVVLEAKSEAGGRTKSMQFDGDFYNVGGNEIGSDCGRFLSLAKTHNIDIVDAEMGGPMTFDVNIGGNMIGLEGWGESEHNPLPDAERNIPPHLLEASLFYSKLPFTGLDDWLKSDFKDLDISQLEYLKTAGVSDQAIAYIDHFSLSPGVGKTSALSVFRDAARYRAAGFNAQDSDSDALYSGLASYRVKGGTQSLCRAVAESLGDSVRYNEVTAQIRHSKNSVSVSTLSGNSYKADFAIITVPLKALSKIDISPALPTVQRNAIDSANYAAGLQVHCRVDNKKLARDGHRAPFVSDGPVEMFSVQPLSDRDFDHGIIWLNGEGAERIDQLPATDVSAYLMQIMKKIRPSSEAALEYMFHYSWSRDPFSGGIRYVYGPGQASTFGPLINKPMDRIVLAGEHARIHDLGMEGALESAFDAVLEILEAAQ